MGSLFPAAAWREALRARADRPPLRPRQPLWWGDACIGSVEPELFQRAGLAGGRLVARCMRAGQEGWSLDGELSGTLAEVAGVLRERGLAHVWRDELLAVRAAGGEMLGVIERAAARPLGIATHAVHLAAVDEAGRHWVQQRAFDKATDPGLWDTLVGGMVPASDGLRQALRRETWEEAGLRLEQLRGLRHGGRAVTRSRAGRRRRCRTATSSRPSTGSWRRCPRACCRRTRMARSRSSARWSRARPRAASRPAPSPSMPR